MKTHHNEQHGTLSAARLLPSDTDATLANSDDVHHAIRVIGEQLELSMSDAFDEDDVDDIVLCSRTVKLVWLRAALEAHHAGISPTALFETWVVDPSQMAVSMVLAKMELGLPFDHHIED